MTGTRAPWDPPETNGYDFGWLVIAPILAALFIGLFF